MLQGFLSQNRSTLAVLAVILLAAGAVAMNYYTRMKRRARRRQVFQEKLRQHQEALSLQQIPSEEADTKAL
jgi:cell division protein FtsL